MEPQSPTVVCPECGARYRAASMEPGKRYRCKHCKREIALPEGEPTVLLDGGRGEPSIGDVIGERVGEEGSDAPPTEDTWDREEQQRVRTDIAIPPPPAALRRPPPEAHRASGPAIGRGPGAVATGGAGSRAPAPGRPRGSSLQGVAFGDYEILSEIGRGGMGIVYKARQRGLDRIVAIKTLIPGAGANPETLRRFEREAKAIAKLGHPNIVPIYEYGEFRRTHYIVMEYVEGKSLDRLVKGPGMSPRVAVELVRDVAFALHFAHAQGIVHRDLKPANVMLDGHGTPKIMDFGLAKEIGSQSLLSVTGDIMGTPAYMSPEQADGRVHEVGVRSDVYSLGAILYELLTGAPPFDGASIAQTIAAVLSEDPVPPRVRNPKVDAELETIVLKALHKESPKRYPSAKAFADDLDRYLRGDVILARPPTIAERLTKTVRRNRASVGAIAAVVLGIALLAVLVAHVSRDELAFFEGKLASPSGEVRASALRALVEEMRQERFEGEDMGRAVGLLVRGASDADEGIRLATLQGLPEISGVRDAAAPTRVALERALAECATRSHTRPVRLAALDAISELGATGAEATLHTILLDPTEDEEVTLKAIRTTARVGYFMRSFVPLMNVLARGGVFRMEAEAAIRRLTEDPKGSGREPEPSEETVGLADSPFIIKRMQRDVAAAQAKRIAALQGLAEGGDGEEKRPLRRMEAVQEKLKSGDQRERLQAIFLLATLKEPSGIGILMGMLGDGDPLVARAAAGGLASIGGPVVRDRLMDAARSADGREMESAAFALGEMRSAEAVDVLVLALARCRVADARKAVAEALGKIGQPRAVPALVQALGDTRGAVADAALASLRRITGEGYGADVEKWTVWWAANG